MEEWFAAFGSEIAHMHFVDGTPYFHLAWGDGNRSLEGYLAAIAANPLPRCAHTGNHRPAGTYDDPAAADAQSYRILRNYM